MPLDPVAEKKILDWIRGACKEQHLRCPHCGSEEISLHDLVALPFCDLAGKIDQAKQLPFVPVICNGCFYTRFFAARPMGLMGATKPAVFP